MTHIVVFYVVQLAACWFALRSGGLPERLTSAALLAAAVGGSAATIWSPYRFQTVDPTLLALDLALLLVLMGVAAAANRFWPIWLSALHLITVTVHGVKAFQPDLVPWMYAAALGKMAYPMMALLAIGTERHRRRRSLYGSDPDWSPLPGKSS